MISMKILGVIRSYPLTISALGLGTLFTATALDYRLGAEKEALRQFSGQRPVTAVKPASEPEPNEPNKILAPNHMNVERNYSDFSFPDELNIIRYTAERVGVDLDLMLAIRESERGRDGLQFGIMPTDAYKKDDRVIEGDGTKRPYKSELEKQASWTAWTIRKNMEDYEALSPEKRLKYQDFIDFLGDRYCPLRADNDPNGLNANWEDNVRSFYKKFSDKD